MENWDFDPVIFRSFTEFSWVLWMCGFGSLDPAIENNQWQRGNSADFWLVGDWNHGILNDCNQKQLGWFGT